MNDSSYRMEITIKVVEDGCTRADALREVDLDIHPTWPEVLVQIADMLNKLPDGQCYYINLPILEECINLAAKKQVDGLLESKKLI